MYYLAQESFNINNIAFLAVIGGVVAGWNQIRGMFQGFIGFFIRSDNVDIIGHKRMKIFLDLFMKKSKKIRWGNVHYCYEDATIYNYQDAPEFYGAFYFTSRKKWIILYKNFIPVILDFQNPDFVKITYLFKTFPMRKIMDEFANIILHIDSANNTVADDKDFFRSGFHYEEVVGNSNFVFQNETKGGQQ